MKDYQHFQIQWQGIEIEIRYTPDWLGLIASGSEYGTAHLEIVQPGRDPLPVTETGYRSHFTPAVYVNDAAAPWPMPFNGSIGRRAIRNGCRPSPTAASSLCSRPSTPF